MTCLICGEMCRCSSSRHSDILPRWLADDASATVPSQNVELPTPSEQELILPPSEQESPPNESAVSASEDSSEWRHELATRLNHYQSRRKPRPPRYPSLRLRFEEGSRSVSNGLASQPPAPPAFPKNSTTVSNQALALDEFASCGAAHALETPVSERQAVPEVYIPPETPQLPGVGQPPRSPASAGLSTVAQAKGKVIEFPRSWTPPPAPLDELAEPVTDRPRILEAPEVAPPPPALGGITIEPAPQPAMEKRPGIDFPLQSASLARRIGAAAVDDAIVAAASTLFGLIFWKMTSIRPPRLQIIGLGIGFYGLFWATYQYLLTVYSGTTLGLQFAGLKLTRFDGSAAGRGLRRWRVLASFLSAISLGMGYAWVFLDEDALCWHDRITHTYLSPKPSETPVIPPVTRHR